MKSYIPHRLLVINQQFNANADDPVLMESMKVAFEWANKMGLEGKSVCNLYLQKADHKEFDPMRQQSILWCKIECTEEERKIWDETQEKYAKLAAINAIKDG